MPTVCAATAWQGKTHTQALWGQFVHTSAGVPLHTYSGFKETQVVERGLQVLIWHALEHKERKLTLRPIKAQGPQACLLPQKSGISAQ